MKNLTMLILILSINLFSAFADNYEKAMLKNIEKLNQTRETEEFINLSNAFDRIAQKESIQWLPYYYSSYCNVKVLFFNRDLSSEAKNQYLDKAQQQLDEAKKITPTESEIYVLQALIYQMRITGPSLGQKFSTLSNTAIAKAIMINPENPRAYYLKGNNTFYTPEQFGGGKDKAKVLFKKAAFLFSSSENKNPLMPNWGSEHTNIMLEQCK